jgi:hypothetical protein
MNKKGTILHYIILGVLASLAIVLIVDVASDIGKMSKGEWHTNFLKEQYIPARIDTLKMEIIGRDVGFEVAKELAITSGFIDNSQCGTSNGVNLFNKKNQWCVPEIDDNLEKLAISKLTERVNDRSFMSVKYKDTILIGDAGKITTTKNLSSYSYNAGFVVDLEYSFDEYLSLIKKGRILVETCRDEIDFINCVGNVTNMNWDYENCDEANVDMNSRKVTFCVNSPKNYNIYIGGEMKVVQYIFALDFRPVIN